MRAPIFSACRQAGITTIEMVMVVGIVSIISTMALPAIFKFINHAAIRSERYALVQDIRAIRYKAIMHGRPAYLCALDGQGKCSRQAHWNQGWMGFVDRNLSRVFDEGDEQVIWHAKPDRGNKVDIIFHARWKDIKFNARGVLGRSGHFRICNPDIQGVQDMQIIRMNTFGRLALEKDELPCE